MMIKWWWDRWVRCNKAQEREKQNGRGKEKGAGLVNSDWCKK